MTESDFRAMHECTWELSKEDRQLNARVKKYIIESAGATLERSHELAIELSRWCRERGITSRKLNLEKMIIGGRINVKN